jgi:hypothetical protein
MPYLSRAERERAQWFTLPEAVAHICESDGCDREAARQQLQHALSDGALGVLRWEDARAGPAGHRAGGATIPLDIPPGRNPDYWRNENINWEAGTVLDHSEYAHPPRHRRLLIRRLALQSHWPNSRRWLALAGAIRIVGDRLGIPAEAAWERIKADIGNDELPTRCLTNRGERCAIDPNWIGFLAQFDFNERDGDIIWFDLRKAAENRTGAAPGVPVAIGGLPPHYAWDIAVDRTGLDELYPPKDKFVERFEDQSWSPTRFADPVWDLRDVIGWVLDRDPAKFGRLMNEIDVDTALFGAKVYTNMPRRECDPNARGTLLHALQRGDLVAHDGETTLPREYWGNITAGIQDFRRALRLAIWFWRDDVLRLWPEAEGSAIADTAQSKRQRPSDEDLDHWMSENWRSGAKRDPTIADCRKATGATVREASGMEAPPGR